MTVPVRPTFESVDPRWSVQITDDGSCTLVDRHCGDAMHSGCGAVAETAWVYLRNSGVAERLQAGQPTRVLEVGLGTGLGCMLTAQQAAQHGTPLEYTAIEYKLTPAAVVRQLAFEQQGIPLWCIDSYLALIASSAGSLTQTPAPTPRPSLLAGSVGEHCRVTIHLTDAAMWRGDESAQYDAIYFDPFSPETSPELWTTNVLGEMQRLLKEDGRLTSYCVNRKVRYTLEAVGFDVQRVPGPPGGKREVLIATRRTGVHTA